MALATATISYNLADLTGVPHFKGTRVTATTNIPGNTIADTEGNLVRLGEGKGTINADGTGTIAVWTPGTGSNPASWQTYVHVLHRVIQGPSQTRTFGPFTVTADATSRTVSNKALTSNVATLTTSVAHGLAVGMSITVTGVDSTFNGTYTIASVPSTTTLTYAKTASNVTSVAATGTLVSPNVNLADLVAEMPVQPEYAMQFLNRIDGVEDHGSVSGAVSIDSDISTHWLDATGTTGLTLTDGPSGEVTRYVSVLVISGAENVIINGLEDATLTDGAFATFAWVRGAWMLAASGGDSGPADVTPPSDITDLGATGGEGELTITGTNPTDAESTARIRYRVWLTADGASGAYTTANSFPIVVTDLDPGAYTVQAYSYSNGGQQTTPDSATATVVPVPVDPRALKLGRSPLYYFPIDNNAGATTLTNLGSGTGSATASGSITFGGTGMAGMTKTATFAGGTITLPTGANLNGLTTFTVEALIDRTSGDAFEGSSAVLAESYVIGNNFFGAAGSFNFTGMPTASPGVHLIGITYDGTTIRLYGDGVQIATLAETGAISASGAGKIGSRGSGSNVFAGRIGEFIVYNTVLTAADMLATAEAHGLA